MPWNHGGLRDESIQSRRHLRLKAYDCMSRSIWRVCLHTYVICTFLSSMNILKNPSMFSAVLKWRFLVCSLLWRCGDRSFFSYPNKMVWILNYIPFTICNQNWVWGQLDTPQYVILKSVVPGIFHGLTMSHPHVLTSVTGVADHNSTNIFQSRAPTMGFPGCLL